jgi:NAD-dependent deacetylase
MSDASAIAELQGLIDAATRVVIFTGAGISTESGIPDFRSPGGVWKTSAPIRFQDFIASEEARAEAWKRRFGLDETLAAAGPNRGHRAVAHLIASGKAIAVITQNIDGLHQAAGVPAEQVIELHGNTMHANCLTCGQHYELGPIRTKFETDGIAPRCLWCDGMVKTATISFGQSMPVAEMRRAEHATLAADLFIVVGSSLVVYPAAAFPELAKQRGATLAIINREETGLDGIADLVINRAIGDILGGATGVN